MKKTVLFIALLAGMAMTFTGCDANVNINVPQESYNAANQVDDSVKTSEQENVKAEKTPEVTTVTEAAAPEVTSAPELTAVSGVTAAAVISAEPENKKEENTPSSDENTKTVYSRACDIMAPGSPFEKGYIESGYREMMSRYYDVEFNGSNIYQYSLNCGRINLGTAWFMTKSEGTVCSLAGNIKSEDQENEYNRIFDYIDSKVGEGNYKIHDAYTERYTDEYGPDYNEVSGNSTHIDIVLNSELDKYTNAADADKSKYIIRFEAEYNGAVKSEYEYYSRREELIKNVISDLKAKSSDYVYGVDKCFFYDYDNVLATVHEPFYSTEKDVLVKGGSEESEYWLTRRREVTAVTDENNVAESELHTKLDLTIYCRPGTDESSLKSILEELYPVTSEYGVGYINIDVLENNSDFDRYEKCDGYIPEETVKVSGRHHFYNNPEFSWMVPGK